ncbi:DUF1016 family protein [Cryobacterium lactosi]|uniref:DUF1016 family protein n=1 Tax=Cryobacterium lactosi TaxID=1259202 RepID=A0A4R9BG16_9MICO|nr:DUF1016 family protein [Cryobacterium lactosi]
MVVGGPIFSWRFWPCFQLALTHAPTVGILICGDRNDHTVRYALSRSGSPMAVSTYTYDALPSTEQDALPDADELTAALGWDGSSQ